MYIFLCVLGYGYEVTSSLKVQQTDFSAMMDHDLELYAKMSPLLLMLLPCQDIF